MKPEERWDNGVYDGEKCTCLETCPDACKGECGCRACHDAYADYLSSYHGEG